MFLRLLAAILLHKKTQFDRGVRLRNKAYMFSITEYVPYEHHEQDDYEQIKDKEKILERLRRVINNDNA